MTARFGSRVASQQRFDHGILLPTMSFRELSNAITFSYKTLGCKVNQAESDEIAEILKARGMQESVSGSPSVSIINTCAVTSLSEQKCRQVIRNIRKNDPDTMIVVTGCYAGDTKAQDALKSTVDLFLTNKEKRMLADKVLERLDHADTVIQKSLDTNPESTENTSLNISKRTRALLKAQDGCNQLCGYCAVPFYRSDLSWRPIEDLARQCEKLIAAGAREIVLTGTNLSLYGIGVPDRDLEPMPASNIVAAKAEAKAEAEAESEGETSENEAANNALYNALDNAPSLAGALNRLGSLAGNYRLRLSSLEVNSHTIGLVGQLFEDLKLAKQFHIPIQSGSDRVLDMMGRRSLTADMQFFIESLREKFPGSTITTDVIVGFPGETEDDVDQTIDFLSKIRPLKVHIFKYSERPGTRSAESKSRVPERVRKERSIRVREAMEAIRADVLRELVGKTLEVLVEKRVSASFGAGWVGYSSEYARVIVQGANADLGEMVKAEIIEVRGDDLIGRTVADRVNDDNADPA